MELNKTDKTLLHLVQISGIGPALVERLIKHLTAEQFDRLYDCKVPDLMHYGMREQTAQKIVDGLADKHILDAELSRLEKHRISFITPFHDTYPALLKHIHMPPIGLYVSGTLPSHYVRSLAIVGSRDAADYAQQVIDHIVPPLVSQDWSIISGGALGADAMAHAATLKAGGTTVAVIGSGLLRPYPDANIGLFNKIVGHGGAVVSAFPLTMEALPANFPARNRIIAGMSRGCLVVQAARKSGALITADFALKEGREVFVIPGSIFEPLSAGCHALLQQGAHVVQHATDIESAYGFITPTMPDASEIAGKKIVAAPSVKPIKQEEKPLPPFLAFCRSPRSVDELLIFAKCTQQELYDLIWEHQIAGHLHEVAAGKWQVRGI